MNKLTLEELLKRADTRLNKVHPLLAEKMREVIKRAYDKEIYVLVTQGLRTIAEQNALYAQGRTKPGQKVTNAKGGYSYHNFGLAVDFAIASPDGRVVYWDTNIDTNKDKAKDWYQVAAIGKSLGLEWGGDFRSFKDIPHFQLTFGLSLSQLRAGKRPAGYSAAAKNYLEQGDQGDKVKELQQNLVKLGYDLEADGIYGKATANTVMTLQRRTGLAADGIAGENTLAKIKVLLEQEKKSNTPGKYRVYTGAFKTEEEAKKQAKLIGEKLGYKPFHKEKRVWTGVFDTLESAIVAQQKISLQFGFNPQIRQE